MLILRTVSDLRSWSRQQRAAGCVVGLVPTMGALHPGHASLLQAAASRCQAVVVSIFVNPTQFGPLEDLASYPRTFDADCKLAEAAGATAVFAPSVEDLYPAGASTFVDVEGLSNRLDGASRPGHFRGVATVVAKLLIAAEPDHAFFGQKDAAQVSVLRRMVLDLGLAVELTICPIVREQDGLALSSRNAYLSPAERQQALVLSRAVRAVEAAFDAGERSSAALLSLARQAFGLVPTNASSQAHISQGETPPNIRIDYLTLVDWSTLEPHSTAQPGSLFAVAAWVGATRLIDNTLLGQPHG